MQKLVSAVSFPFGRWSWIPTKMKLKAHRGGWQFFVHVRQTGGGNWVSISSGPTRLSIFNTWFWQYVCAYKLAFNLLDLHNTSDLDVLFVRNGIITQK